MKDLYEKLCVIIGEILCYSHKIAWASAPIFGEGYIIIKFMDFSNNTIEIQLPHIDIVKVHDHSLESYVFKLAKDKGLL